MRLNEKERSGSAGRAVCCGSAVFALYLLMFFAVSWPLAAGLGSVIIGDVSGTDLAGHYNNYWASAVSPGYMFVNPYVFHPYGKKNIIYNGGYLDVLLSIPLTRVFNVNAAYNLVAALFAAFTGFSAYYFCRSLSAGNILSAAAGAAAMFSPNMTEYINKGSIEQINQGFIILYLAVLFKLYSRGTVRIAAAGGVLLFFASIGCLEYGLFGALALLPWLLVSLLTAKKARAADILKYLGVLLAVFFALFAVPMSIYLRESMRSFSGLYDNSAMIGIETLRIMASFDLADIASALGGYYPFILLVFVPLAFLNKGSRKTAVLMTALLLYFLLLSAGPYIIFNKYIVIKSRLYGLHLSAVPFFSRLHLPDRMLFLPVLLLNALLVMGLETAAGLKNAKARPVIYAAVFIAAALCLLMPRGIRPGAASGGLKTASIPGPYVLSRPETPSFYAILAKDTSCEAVIEIPFENSSILSTRAESHYEIYQPLHGKKMYNGIGMDFLASGEYLEFSRNNTVLQFLTLLQARAGMQFNWLPAEKRLGSPAVKYLKQGALQDYQVAPGDIRALSELGFGCLIYHADYLSGRVDSAYIRTNLDRIFGVPEKYGQTLVYRL